MIFLKTTFARSLWQIGDPLPQFSIGDQLVAVAATGRELEQILKLPSFPLGLSPQVIWRNDVAKFIVDNLRLITRSLT